MTTPRVLVFCDEPAHDGKEVSVERFHHVADGHWVADAHRGAHGPRGRRLNSYTGETTAGFRAGHRNAVLRCPRCGLDLQRAMTAVEPILNQLATAGLARVSLRQLIRLTC